ncbi:hypothetical protein MKY37_21980 [Psychrobacillus sp. FSL K6-2836]|uniref:hypothetical protein n=1 Tax=Psychrobacillus sp. FSL K6-2836 TaxID=2921548 RepID=UPI0030F55B6D
MNEVIVQRTINEENYPEGHYEDLYNLLQRTQFKEKYKKAVLDNPYMRKQTEFDARVCLSVALSFLTDIGELEGEEIAKIIINESYRGVYKLLERGIQK